MSGLELGQTAYQADAPTDMACERMFPAMDLFYIPTKEFIWSTAEAMVEFQPNSKQMVLHAQRPP